MKPFSRIIAFLFLALALVSCGEDVPVPVPEPGGPDSYVGIARKFTFGPEVTGFVYKNYTLRLKAPDGSLISRPGSHQRSADVSEFTLDTGLADGRYVMTLATPEGAGIGGRLMADFADSRLRNVAFKAVSVSGSVAAAELSRQLPRARTSCPAYRSAAISRAFRADPKSAASSGMWLPAPKRSVASPATGTVATARRPASA